MGLVTLSMSSQILPYEGPVPCTLCGSLPGYSSVAPDTGHLEHSRSLKLYKAFKCWHVLLYSTILLILLSLWRSCHTHSADRVGFSYILALSWKRKPYIRSNANPGYFPWNSGWPKRPNASHSFRQKQHALKREAGAARNQPSHPPVSRARGQLLFQSILIRKTLKGPRLLLSPGQSSVWGVLCQTHFWPQKQAGEKHNQYGLRRTHGSAALYLRYRWLWAAWWVLGLKPGSSGRAASAEPPLQPQASLFKLGNVHSLRRPVLFVGLESLPPPKTQWSH